MGGIFTLINYLPCQGDCQTNAQVICNHAPPSPGDSGENVSGFYLHDVPAVASECVGFVFAPKACSMPIHVLQYVIHAQKQS